MFSINAWNRYVRTSYLVVGRAISTFKYSDLKVIEATSRKTIPDGELGFGKYFTDHLFIVTWNKETGWRKPEIREFGSLLLSPAVKSIHYATSAFEGMKAMRGHDNCCRIFRPDMHINRLRRSTERLSLPDFDASEFLKCIKKLIRLDARWIPKGEGEALYIRPFIFGTDPTLGIDISADATICVLLSPVGSYFSASQKGVALLADPKFVRAWEGGCGAFKISANYAPTLFVQKLVKEKGCQTALWLYGSDERLTEAGTMNIFLLWTNEKGEKELITPPLNGLILPGITRDSILQIAREWNEFPVREAEITMSQVLQAIQEGRLHSMFGTGTACVISPVSTLMYKDQRYEIKGDPNSTEIVKRIYKTLTDIQWGRSGPHKWAHCVDES